MRRFFDGLLSGFAACATAAIIGVPVWSAVMALRDGLVPAWAWAPVVLLGAAGAVMVLSFLRKAGRGVHPLRDRRR
ncbi:MAG: hypothetical protein AAGK71_03040 [Pseudomonadota bacterium]